MPEENPIPEAIEKVAHAVEKAFESDPPKSGEPPPARPKDKLKSWASLITAIAALLAAAGAFLKTFDHSITENAYNTLSTEIQKLAEEQDKTNQDLVALRGYLDGLSRAPLIPVPPASASAAVAMAPPSSSAAPHLRPLTRPIVIQTPAQDAGTTASKWADAGTVTFAVIDTAEPLPPVHRTEKLSKPPAWSKIENGM